MIYFILSVMGILGDLKKSLYEGVFSIDACYAKVILTFFIQMCLLSLP